MKPLLLAAALALAMTAQGRSWSINLTDGTELDAPQSTMPYRDIEQVDDGIIVTYRFNYANLQDATDVTGAVNWSIPGFGANYVAGEPATLFRNDRFLIPDGKSCSVSLLNCEYRDFDVELSPAREYSLASDTTTNNRVTPIKPYDGFFPQTAVEGYNRGRYRGKGIYYACVSPIQYNYQTKKVRAYTTLSYKITYSDATSPLRKAPAKQHYISPDDNFLSSLIQPVAATSRKVRTSGNRIDSAKIYHQIDSTLIRHRVDSGLQAINPGIDRLENFPQEVTKDYLVITTSELLPAAKRIADWKQYMGFSTHILHAAKGMWGEYDDVKEAILSFYKQHPKLYHILIIGKHDDVPAEEKSEKLAITHTSRTNYITDYSYGRMDDDEEYPSVYVGRLPMSSLEDAHNAVDKLITYELNPALIGAAYKYVASVVHYDGEPIMDGKAYEERGCHTLTAENIRTYLNTYHSKDVKRIYASYNGSGPKYYDGAPYATGEKLPDELQYPKFAWDADSTNISKRINAGALFVATMAHGFIDEWIYPKYTIKNIANLHNGRRRNLPLIFSMSCRTGEFDLSDTCMPEAFLKNPNGGAFSVIAASYDSYAGWNDALLTGMIDAIWPNPGLIPTFNITEWDEPFVPDITPTPTPTYELGQILAQGKLRMEETFRRPYHMSFIPYIQEIFHCFGDPSILFKTERPSTFDEYVTLTRKNKVSVDLGSIKAKISFIDTKTGKVQAYYGKYATYNTDDPESVIVCVSGHNMIPCISYNNENSYVQNTTLSAIPILIHNKNIYIGENVDPSQPEGPVRITSRSAEFKGERIELRSGVTLDPNSRIKFTNEKIKRAYEK